MGNIKAVLGLAGEVCPKLEIRCINEKSVVEYRKSRNFIFDE